ncbi:MAG: autotransporter outer membrane beta-barrel domain-containing protein [Aliarcobacter sp.]
MEDLDDGINISQLKDEMIAIQRKLTPIANSSNIQTTLMSTNLATTTIGSRLSDIRRTEANNFTPNIYSGNYAGLSSGDYGYDTSFWVKVWAQSYSRWLKDYYGYDTTTYGFVAGMDKTMYDGTIFGIALGYSDTKTNQDNEDSDTSNTNSVQATIYSSKEIGNSYVDGYLSYSKHTTDGTRTANSGKVSSSVDSEQISAKVEAGHKFIVNDELFL